MGLAARSSILDIHYYDHGLTSGTRAFTKVLHAIALAKSRSPQLCIGYLKARTARNEFHDRRWRTVQLDAVQMPQLSVPLAQALSNLSTLHLHLSEINFAAAGGDSLPILQAFWCGGNLEDVTLGFGSLNDRDIGADGRDIGAVEISGLCLHHLAELPPARKLSTFRLKDGYHDANDLVKFVSKHATSLEELEMVEVWLVVGHWDVVLLALRACSKLTSLRVSVRETYDREHGNFHQDINASMGDIV